VQRGEYLTRAADCEACHTATGGAAFAGGRAFRLPFGTLYSSNITPDHETGIGDWSDSDFLAAVHKGIGRQGEHLYPAFPFTSYTMMTDDDVLAIKAYLFSLKPVRQPIPQNTLAFPYNQRALMAVWSAMFNSDSRFRPIANRTAEWNRGAYLVEAAGHCAECHSPRNILQAVDGRQKFSGANVDGWNAYNITNDPESGIGKWTPEALTQYLSTGFAVGHGSASGPMREVIDLSLSHLDPADIKAIVMYLSSVSPLEGKFATGDLAPAASSSHRVTDVSEGMGKGIFEGACASCHAWNGSGALRAQAQLTGSRAVNDETAANVAHMVLFGSGKTSESHPLMPAFGSAYSSVEIAAVANYVTGRFGKIQAQLTADQVEKMRSEK
jgi:mono/diheme cytochrome c family protein